MGLSVILLYTSFLLSASVTINLAYRMKRAYTWNYVNTLFYFVLLFYLSVFFTRPWSTIIVEVLGLKGAQQTTYFALQYTLLIRPLNALGLYLLYRVTVEIRGGKISRKFTWSYFAFWAVFLAVILYHVLGFLKTGELSLVPVAMYHFSDWAGLMFILSICAILFYRSGKLEDPGRRTAGRGFGGLLFLGFIVFNVTGILTMGGGYLDFIFLFVVVPPVVFLYFFLAKHKKEHPGLPDEEAELQVVFEKYGITGREQEVIRLVSRGKTNREIADELFVSLQTVKLHVHNIYRKIGVKNRVQLSNFIRNSIKN